MNVVAIAEGVGSFCGVMALGLRVGNFNTTV